MLSRQFNSDPSIFVTPPPKKKTSGVRRDRKFKTSQGGVGSPAEEFLRRTRGQGNGGKLKHNRPQHTVRDDNPRIKRKEEHSNALQVKLVLCSSDSLRDFESATPW